MLRFTSLNLVCVAGVLFGLAQPCALGAADEDFQNEIKLIPAASSANDRVGRSVAISADGSTVVLGAPSGFIGSEGPGAAYIYTREAGIWSAPAGLLPGDSSPADQFGDTVAVSGDGMTVAIRSWYTSAEPGAVYVFTLAENGWTEQTKLLDEDLVGYFGSGLSFNADGSLLAVGTPSDTGADGVVYLYVWNGSTWVRQEELTPASPNDSSGFGRAAALNDLGDTLVVGSNTEDSVYVFVDNGFDWIQQAHLIDTELGSAVDVSADGDHLVASGNFVWSSSGYASIYSRDGGVWTEEISVSASDAQNGDWFGSRVAIDDRGSMIVVGAGFADAGSEPDAGAAYVYRRSGETWGEVQKILASDATYNDEFGNALALDGDGTSLIVGAHNKDFFAPPFYRGAGYAFESLNLVFTIEPDAVSAGDTMVFRTTNGLPDGALMLAAVEIDGSPLFLRILLATFDETGEFLQELVAPDLAGLEATFQTFGIGLDGKVRAGNVDVLTFE